MKKKHQKRFKRMINCLHRVADEKYNSTMWAILNDSSKGVQLENIETACAFGWYILLNKTKCNLVKSEEVGGIKGHDCYARRKDEVALEAAVSEFGITNDESLELFRVDTLTRTEKIKQLKKFLRGKVKQVRKE